MRTTLKIAALAGVAAVALAGAVAVGQTSRSASAVTAVKIPERVDNFRLTDQNSKSHELYYYKNAAAVVIVTYANDAFSKEAAPAVEALQKTYAAKGVRFLMLDDSAADTRDKIGAAATKAGLSVPVMMDDAQLVGESLGASRTAEAFVLDPKTWRVVYHGPIDNRFAGKVATPKAAIKTAYVADALDAMLSGSTIKVSTSSLDSPALSFPARDRQADFVNISYAKEVAPILSKNCVACHSQGGIGPFALDSYEKVKGFAPMIREVIRTDRMPPYNADPHIGKFKDDMNLTVADQKTLVHWIEAGAPRGTDAVDPLKASAKPAPEWPLGPPDLVLEFPAFDVPASGIVDYQYPVLTVPLSETRWVKAVTVKPGDRQVLHHITGPLTNYAVGAETVKLPEGQGIELKPGQPLRFSMHYTPMGKAVTDHTRVGLYFYPKDQAPTLVRRNAVIANAAIEIPPGEARHREIAYMDVPHDATIYSIFPHAHYRGENAYVSIQRPGQKEEPLVSLPKYDFNWQRGYYFEKPVSAPAGSRIITRYEYDNSKNNPANPDPNLTIHWGEQSWEEMQYTEMSITWKDETSKNQKPEYMTELNNSRALGILDTNLDSRVEKAEMRGKIGEMILAKWDQLDVNHDGFLDKKELAAVTPLLNRRVEDAQKVFEKGETTTKP